MTRKRPGREATLSKQCMIRMTPEEWQAQNAAAKRDGRPWANWARKVLAEAALAARKTP